LAISRSNSELPNAAQGLTLSPAMKSTMTMIYWKSDKFWLGRLREHPEIMTQGRTLKELEENMRDAYQLMVMEDVPRDYALKEIAV